MDPSLKLAFDKILRKFNEIEARMERSFSRTMAALEQRGNADELRDGDLEQIDAEKGAAKTEQFVVVDNWAGLFDEIPTTSHEPVPVPDDLPFAAVADVAFYSELHSTDLDCLSLLPDELLRNIVSRLPVKDAGRMVVLSRRWRPLWRAAWFTSPMRSDSVSMELLPMKARLTVVRGKERIEAQPFSLEVQFAPEIVDRLVGDLSAPRATRLRQPRHHPPRPPWRRRLRQAPPPRGPRRAPPRPPRFRQPRRAPPRPPWLRPSPSTRTRRGPCRSPSAPSSGPYATGSRSTASRSTPKAAASAFREFTTFSFPNSSHSSCAADDGAVDPIDPGPKFALQNSFRIHGGAEVADLFRKLGFIGAANIVIYRGFQLPGSGDALTCFLHGGALNRCALVFPTVVFEASSTSSTRKAAASTYHVWLGIFPVRSEASRGTPCYTTNGYHFGKVEFPGKIILAPSWCSTPGPNHGEFVSTTLFATLAPSSTPAGGPDCYITLVRFSIECPTFPDCGSELPKLQQSAPNWFNGSVPAQSDLDGALLLSNGSCAGEHAVLLKLLVDTEAVASPSDSSGNTTKTLLRDVAFFLFSHDGFSARYLVTNCPSAFMLYLARCVIYFQAYTEFTGIDLSFTQAITSARSEDAVGLWWVNTADDATSAATEQIGHWLVVATGEDAERIVVEFRGTQDAVSSDSHVRPGPDEQALGGYSVFDDTLCHKLSIVNRSLNIMNDVHSFDMLVLEQLLVIWAMPMLRDSKSRAKDAEAIRYLLRLLACVEAARQVNFSSLLAILLHEHYIEPSHQLDICEAPFSMGEAFISIAMLRNLLHLVSLGDASGNCPVVYIYMRSGSVVADLSIPVLFVVDVGCVSHRQPWPPPAHFEILGSGVQVRPTAWPTFSWRSTCSVHQSLMQVFHGAINGYWNHQVKVMWMMSFTWEWHLDLKWPVLTTCDGFFFAAISSRPGALFIQTARVHIVHVFRNLDNLLLWKGAVSLPCVMLFRRKLTILWASLASLPRLQWYVFQLAVAAAP